MLENRFMLTIGAGIVIIVILGVYFIVSSIKSSAKKKKAAGATGASSAASNGKEEFMRVDSNGLPLDDDDDGVYKDSNLFGKSKKATKEEYYKDWD